MRLKLRHIRKALTKTGRAVKKVSPLIEKVAPVVEVLPGAPQLEMNIKVVKHVYKAGKRFRKKGRSNLLK